MESSEEEDDFPCIESIIPQSKVDSLYQSHTEQEIRRMCCELMDLKDAVENLCGNMQTKYLAFLRISEEAVEMEHELVELRKHLSSQRILVQDLMTGVCHELEQWNQSNDGTDEVEDGVKTYDPQVSMSKLEDSHNMVFLDNVDILLAEHKVEEALEALDAEERNSPDLKVTGDISSELSSYKSAFLKRKAMLEEQMIEIAEQPFVSLLELKKALSGLLRLGKGSMAHQLLLKSFGSRLQRSTTTFLPSCAACPKTFSATLCKLVFSAISLATKESASIFGDDPIYTNRVVQWAEWEIEFFVRLVKENAPSSETVSALRAACICIHASLNYCSLLETQGLKLSKLLLVLLRSFMEEVLELNFRRARRAILDLAELDENLVFSSRFASSLSAFATSSDSLLVVSGMKFMHIIDDILEQLTSSAILHFGDNVLNRIAQLFDKYMDALLKALPSPSDDENLTELKEAIPFRVETDSEQLAILGIAFTIMDELLPDVVMTIWDRQDELGQKNESTETVVYNSGNSIELKDWKRHLQLSFDRLRDHFCLQYVLGFIYSREGKTRLDAWIYLNGDGDDHHWGSDPRPSLPFQALFARLQQLAIVAGDVLLGKEKIQKILLARLTETVLIWLSDEQEFWGVFEDDSVNILPFGLQQLILDMHFTVEIARFAGYPSRHIHQLASAIIARAIRTFSARGIDPQRKRKTELACLTSALPEDEWFAETAKSTINKLLSGVEGSDGSEIDDEHIIMHDEDISDSDDTDSSLSTLESTESFASASMGELESPSDLTDSEN